MLVQGTSYFHLSGSWLERGSIILPGNWGRVVAFYQWRHVQALREMALEAARIARYPHRPSRLKSAFVFITEEEAREFRARIQDFSSHLLYRVALVDPDALSFVTDTRLCGPQGTLRPDWADIYWIGGNPAQIRGIISLANTLSAAPESQQAITSLPR